MHTLAVRNAAQKVLFDSELSGQISDGNWENATPHDHWVVWCDARVVVKPENVGRDFYARKTNYNFLDSRLLEVVADRMVEAVREQANLPEYSLKDLREDLRDLKTIVRLYRESDPEEKAYRAQAEADRIFRQREAEERKKATQVRLKEIVAGLELPHAIYVSDYAGQKFEASAVLTLLEAALAGKEVTV